MSTTDNQIRDYMNSLLNNISNTLHNHVISDSWVNGKLGAISPISEYAYIFIEYQSINGVIHEIYVSDDSKKNCPIVAQGLVAYWLKYRHAEGTTELFEHYYNYALLQYQRECAKKVDISRDCSTTFLRYEHLNRERKLMKLSETLCDFLTAEDQKLIFSVIDSYKAFVLRKRIAHHLNGITTNTPIFESFCMFYRQFKTACEAADWVENKYDLGCTPHNEKKQKPQKWRDYYEVELPEIIRDWLLVFDSDKPINVDSQLREEIYQQFVNCKDDADKWRLAQDYILPFKEFARHFHHTSEIRNVEESLQMLDTEAKQADQDDDSQSEYEAIKARKLADIERLKARELAFYDIVQKAFECDGQEPYSIEYCLAVYWSSMCSYATMLAAILLRFGIDMNEVQDECDVYLLHRVRITDYVDYHYVSTFKHASSLLKKCDHRGHNQNKQTEFVQQEPRPNMDSKKKVFIVHGRDNSSIAEVENFIMKTGLTPIVLKEQTDGGRTIIEKIEEYTDVSYAIVIYNPCDIGYYKNDSEDSKRPRARQNVIFEHGYLVNKLGRKNVCALVSDNSIELPSDISGILYKFMDSNGTWKFEVAKEMKSAGLGIDINNLI